MNLLPQTLDRFNISHLRTIFIMTVSGTEEILLHEYYYENIYC